MASGSLLLFLALLIVVALIVVRPLVVGGAEQTGFDEESSHWLAERERVLDALAELDADWQLGKVPKEIYASQRAQLLAKGAVALEMIEKISRSVSKQIHKYTSKRGNKGKPRSRRNSVDELEKMIADYKKQHRGGK